ncbi:Conserved_hypothetical protein [Hexamita inflata]|uniref:Uncharacterized protein n=1 Tax=Hexamita inflata TaxID=28002 RepID=A0AA86TV71_9EUKA|nr:Conserved hypothetical protein [Hexamita inflata]
MNFAPDVFNAGNRSSYLFSEVNSSNVLLDDISIVLGTIQNPMLSNYISTTSTNYFQFGGLVSNQNSTTLRISNIQYDIKQTLMIFYITNSGLLIGNSNSTSNNVTIQHICLSHIIKSYTSFNVFGVIGYFEGTIQIQQSNILISIQSADKLSYIGVIGSITNACIYTNIQNIITSVDVNENTGRYISALVASHTSLNCTILNSTVQNSHIQSAQYTGGFIGFCNSLVVIQYSTVINSAVKSGLNAGGIIGYAYSNIQISNTTVQNISVGNGTSFSSFMGGLQIGSVLTISNDQAINVTVSGVTHAGGIIGYAEYNSNIQIAEVLISNSSFSASSSNAGAFLGTFSEIYYGCIMKIVKSSIYNITINSPQNAGLIVGYQYPSYSVSTSLSQGNNYINNIKQQNCVNFANTCNIFTNTSAPDIYTNIIANETQIQTTLIACNQFVYIQTFDINCITNSLSIQDFAGGFVFSISNIITNAFIDIQDNSYTAKVTNLFQSQNIFDNIKIQIGTQVIGSGSLISTNTVITINNVNIISKLGSTITVNSTYKLNILMAKAVQTNINNLLLNLIFAPSQGSIALIGIVDGSLNITKYQVLGFYISLNYIALVTIKINSSQIKIYNINFAPDVFNAGNRSSYLFSEVNSSNVLLDDISIVLGTIQNPMLSNYISTTSTNYFQFGGLVSNQNSTTLRISNIQYDIKQTLMIFYITNSGLLIGNSNSTSNNVTIQHICLSHIIKSYTSFNVFGVIGYFEGTIQIQQSNILISIQSADKLSYIGVIGSITNACIYTNIQNIITSVDVNENTGRYISALVASHTSLNCTILNSTVQNSHIQSAQYTGGFIGFCNSLVVIQYSTVINSAVKSGLNAGGIIGYAYSNIQISNTTVQNISVGNGTSFSSFMGGLQIGSVLTISNDQAINVTVSGVTHAGGIIGYAEYNSNIQIAEVLISNSSFSASSSNAGAFLGTFSEIYYGCIMKIVKSSIYNITINSPQNAGLIVGYRYPAYTVLTSISEGYNYINNIKQNNCDNFAPAC